MTYRLRKLAAALLLAGYGALALAGQGLHGLAPCPRQDSGCCRSAGEHAHDVPCGAHEACGHDAGCGGRPSPTPAAARQRAAHSADACALCQFHLQSQSACVAAVLSPPRSLQTEAVPPATSARSCPLVPGLGARAPPSDAALGV